MCYYSRIQKRDASSFDNPRQIEVIPYGENPEPLPEAIMRHQQSKWYPKLVLQDQSIHEKTYESAKSKLKIKPHEKVESLPKFPSYDPNQKITFADTCLVYIIYENDFCRCEAEKEENTLDIASSQ